jgi:hypothetical protein
LDFGEVLGRAWRITWKFKVLWIFGILASCGTSSGGSYNSGSYSNYQTNGNGFPRPTPNLPPGFVSGIDRFVRFMANPAVIVAFLSLICLIVIISILVGTMGRIGLIKGASEADEGAEKLTFTSLWRSSLHYFWRLLWLSVLVGLPFFIIFLVLGVGLALALLPAIKSGTSEAAGAGIIGLVSILCVGGCFLILLAIAVGFVLRQAENAIVIENQTILGGLQRGWEVFKKNIGPIFIIWLITAGILLAGRFVIALPILIILIPIFIAFFSLGAGGTISYAPLIIAGLCILAYLPVSVVANGILMTFVESIWTLTFLRLTKPKPAEASALPLTANA